MPNHITNWVEISGDADAIAKLKADVLVKVERTPKLHDDSIEFDFNGIRRMPPELKDTVAPTQVVATQDTADAINGEYKALPGQASIMAISQDEADRRNEEYNALNWYDWANDNWGTKWGAYNGYLLYEDDTRLVVKFDTASCPPRPIFELLEGRGLAVNCYWEDEDPTNSGEYGDPYDVFEIRRTVELEYCPPTQEAA